MAARWRRSSRLAPALATTGVVLAVGVVSESFRLRPGIDAWLPDLLAGASLAVAGAVITAIDPRSGLGFIVTLAGLAWFLPNFRGVELWPIALLAESAVVLHRAVLFHAVVSFPDGHVRRSSERVVVALAYVVALGDLMRTEVPAVLWSVGAVLAFGAVIATRTGSAHVAGMRAVPVMVLLAAVVGGTNLLFLRFGNSPPPQAIVHAYEAGLAAVAVVLTVTVARYQSRRSSLTAAAVELTQGRAGYVRDLLATALRDPTVEVAFAADATAPTTWVDELGRPIDALRASGSRAVIPIVVDGQPVAELACESVVAEDPEFRRSIETAARLAARNARLRAGLRSEADQLRASQVRLLTAADDQRIALAQQLERGAGASLQELGPLLDAVPDDAAPAVRSAVDRSRARVDRLTAGLRSLSAGLGPADLGSTGLEDALSGLTAGFDGRLNLNVDAPELPDSLAAATYFICAEGIANAVKHAGASEICVTVERRGDRLLISIVDDGRGGASVDTGSGLRGLADRATALGGSLSLVSPSGEGTRLSVDLPVP